MDELCRLIVCHQQINDGCKLHSADVFVATERQFKVTVTSSETVRWSETATESQEVTRLISYKPLTTGHIRPGPAAAAEPECTELSQARFDC